jgi:uncharacterized protein (TIGR03435 family)
MSYNLHPRQITGGPSWLESEKYDVTGKPDESGQPNVPQIKLMLQKLLADRFQLKFHRDKKEMAAYTITVTKGGVKFKPSDRDLNSLPGLFFRGLGNLAVTNAPLSEFANLLQTSVLERPVVDQTGLSGKYDFTLRWTPDASQFGGRGGNIPPPADGTEPPPDLYAAFEQQLGLKLESTKAPVDVLVIDHVEKPSEN